MIVLFGAFLGLIIFMFAFIASKKGGKFYLAPLVTFFVAFIVAGYGLIVIRGFEGMAYGMLSLGILLIAIIGTMLLPLLLRKPEKKSFNRKDKFGLVILPIVFFASICFTLYMQEGYWVIEKGEKPYVEQGTRQNYYSISTISEGKKMIHLILGEEYSGKEIEVERVSKWGPSEITVKIVEGGSNNKAPYIKIGLDEIIEPLKVQTTDGLIFDSILD